MSDKISVITTQDLNPLKLSLISFGSLAGMGLGLLLSLLFTSTIARLIIGLALLGLSITIIFKNIHLLK